MLNTKKILKEAKKLNKTIIFPEAGFSDRTVEAVKILNKKKICKVLLVGDESSLVIRYPELQNFEIVNPKTSPLKDKLIKVLMEKRAKDNLTREQAEEAILDPHYFATLLVEIGIADGMVGGAEVFTANNIRPALQIIKSAKKGEKVSSCMILYGKNKFLRGKTILLADCGVNPNPSADDLACTAEKSVETYLKLGLTDPKVAFLSYSTNGSAEDEVILKIREAVKKFKKKGYTCDGEIQFDSAMVPEVAKLKTPNSELKGDANILIFPGLNSGNISYKIMQYVGGLNVIGPILMGLKKPVNDLSRGCSVDDIVMLTAVTILQTKKEKSK